MILSYVDSLTNTNTHLGHYLAPGFSPASAALKGGATVNECSERNTTQARETTA